MIRKKITVQSGKGLEPTAIALLVQTANVYKSQVYIELETKRINAKSIMGMMSLGYLGEEEAAIFADGEDEEGAVAGMEKVLADCI